MSKLAYNEALKVYHSEQRAKRARIAYKALHKRSVSDVFKHLITDKRVKNKQRYAFILDVKQVELKRDLFSALSEMFYAEKLDIDFN